MNIPTLPGIEALSIETERLKTRVLFSGPSDGVPVLFLHGNLSSATWWEETMVSLPDGYRGIAPDLRGFGGADPAKKVDATRGMRDLADDILALLDHLGHAQAHLVGSSLGGCVVWQLMMDRPQAWLSVIQVAPGSPYGFGGTKGLTGTPCYDDCAGSGGGLINPLVAKLAAEGNLDADNPMSMRSAMRSLVFRQNLIPEREEALLASTLSVHMGEQDWPGDMTPSPNWPFVGPGLWGANNALSPKYIADPAGLPAIDSKPPVLWLRGGLDLVVSDTAASDPGALGAAGYIPGWPGMDAYPPQPMLGQTRAVLDAYASAGGSYRAMVIEDAAHAPYIDSLDSFNTEFHAWLQSPG